MYLQQCGRAFGEQWRSRIYFSTHTQTHTHTHIYMYIYIYVYIYIVFSSERMWYTMYRFSLRFGCFHLAISLSPICSQCIVWYDIRSHRSIVQLAAIRSRRMNRDYTGQCNRSQKRYIYIIIYIILSIYIWYNNVPQIMHYSLDLHSHDDVMTWTRFLLY